ncbi:hypothetical protein YSU_08415 [Campylobacter coli RM5611]|nr:hypothetical protein YSU_08415 [Campylobacter coli RM5611]EFM37001.1 hypothetical protein HMPREF9399_1157 [Campylobacter coli JV20]
MPIKIIFFIISLYIKFKVLIITNLILKLTQSSQNGVNLYKNFVRLNAEIAEFFKGI